MFMLVEGWVNSKNSIGNPFSICDFLHCSRDAVCGVYCLHNNSHNSIDYTHYIDKKALCQKVQKQVM